MLCTEWMKDPFILEMTASEPLSLEEEFEMQQSWAEDPKKATFIVTRLLPKSGTSTEENTDDAELIGDVNLFFNDYDDPKSAEIDIMIAGRDSRGQGFGREAVLLMFHYALTRLDVSRFFCKINETNEASLKLFRK
jgi:RimJ/RimL family protein N-acetyltransferase